MRYLGFSPRSDWVSGKRIRKTGFEERSLFPTSAACLVANGVRELLSRVFGTETHVKLLEPRIPSPQAWVAIARDARCFRLRGNACDAAIVLARRDIASLARAAFGEFDANDAPLSTVEASVFDRALASLAGAFAPACGFRGDPPAFEELQALHGFATYFDLVVERPVRLRLGVALSREPAPPVAGTLSPSQLLDVDLELTATLDACVLPARALTALHPGQFVPITDGTVLRGTLSLAGVPIARGECGVRSGRYAVALNER